MLSKGASCSGVPKLKVHCIAVQRISVIAPKENSGPWVPATTLPVQGGGGAKDIPERRGTQLHGSKMRCFHACSAAPPVQEGLKGTQCVWVRGSLRRDTLNGRSPMPPVLPGAGFLGTHWESVLGFWGSSSRSVEGASGNRNLYRLRVLCTPSLTWLLASSEAR